MHNNYYKYSHALLAHSVRYKEYHTDQQYNIPFRQNSDIRVKGKNPQTPTGMKEDKKYNYYYVIYPAYNFYTAP